MQFRFDSPSMRRNGNTSHTREFGSMAVSIVIICTCILLFFEVILSAYLQFPRHQLHDQSTNKTRFRQRTHPKSALIVHEHFPMLWEGGDLRILQIAQA